MLLLNVIAELCLTVVEKASRSFIRPDAGCQGMVKTGSEANIANMSSSLSSSSHSASAANLAMTTSTPSLSLKSNNTADTPTVTLTNLVSVITDIQTLVAEVTGFCLLLNRVVGVYFFCIFLWQFLY